MPPSTSSDPTVDVKGAANIMKVHPETVKEMILAGAIPAAKIGRGWVMQTIDVLKIVQQQIAAQTAARMGGRRVTKARRPGRSHAGSRSASSSGGSCAP